MPHSQMRWRLAWCGLVATGFLAAAAPRASALSYTMELLEPFEGGSRAEDIGEDGVVVGWVGGGETLHPARWQSPDVAEDLGLLDPTWPYAYGYANGVAAGGVVVGFSSTRDGERAFRWSPESGIEALPMPPGPAYGEATDVNDLGQIVLNWGNRAWLLQPDGASIDLGSLNADGSARPRDITNTGLVAGISALDSGAGRGFVWTAADGMRPIDGLGPAGWSAAFAANDRGEVVGMAGYVMGDGTRHAFLWNEATGIRDLGTGGERESIAQDINESGQVVGFAVTTGVRAVAALWDPVLGFVDLNDVVENLGDLRLDEAVAINDRGQIAANTLVGGHRRGVLLTPVPEPGTLVLAAIGLALVARLPRGGAR